MRISTLVICLIAFSAAFAQPLPAGPFNYSGRTYYIVNASNPALNTGTAVCAAVGLQCVGYTDWDTSVCQMAHPNANSIYGDQGSKAGFYCNGPPSQGVCSGKYDTCDICDQCNVNADCNTTIGQFEQEMYVQCAANASDWLDKPPPGFHPGVPSVGPSINSPWGFLTPITSFFGWLFSPVLSFFSGIFGPSPSPSAGGAPTPPPALCPQACYLTSVGIGNGGTADINCNVDASAVHTALSICPGTETDVGQGQPGQGPPKCSCQPVETVSAACPASCTTTQPGCAVNPGVAGSSGIPCDGTVPGASMNCKCIFRNGGWVVGAQYGVR